MKKSLLKEVIQNILSKKLQEVAGKPTHYGYILSGKGTEDPRLQMVGYGNQTASVWKRRIEEDAKKLLELIQKGDWHNAASIIANNGVFSSAVNMMDEVFSDPKLKEQFDTNSAIAANPTVTPQETGATKDQTDLQKCQKQLDDITNNIKTADANIAKRMDAVTKANKKDELQKQSLTKRQGPIVAKIDQIKKKISQENGKPQISEIAVNEPAVNPSYKDVKVGDKYLSVGTFKHAYLSTVLEVTPITMRFSKEDRVVTVKIQAFDPNSNEPGSVIDQKKKIWVSQLLKGLI